MNERREQCGQAVVSKLQNFKAKEQFVLTGSLARNWLARETKQVLFQDKVTTFDKHTFYTRLISKTIFWSDSCISRCEDTTHSSRWWWALLPSQWSTWHAVRRSSHTGRWTLRSSTECNTCKTASTCSQVKKQIHFDATTRKGELAGWKLDF